MLHFTQRGSGPRTVLLLHGFMGSGRNLSTLARRLVEVWPGSTVATVDLPGHGHSPPLGPGDDFGTAAEQVLEVGAALGGNTLELVGHSLGGRIALTALGRAPERLRRVTLLDIGPSPTLSSPSEAVGRIFLEAPDHPASREAAIEDLIGRGLSRGLSEWLSMNLEASPDGLAWRIDRAAIFEFHRRTSPLDLWPIVEAHPSQLHAIVGGTGGYVPLPDQARMRALGVPVDVIPEAGHFLHVDALDTLLSLLQGIVS